MRKGCEGHHGVLRRCHQGGQADPSAGSEVGHWSLGLIFGEREAAVA